MATNVRLSGAQTTPRSEADIRLNYVDPTRIIGASNSISAVGTQAQFFSSDGGVTWGQTTLPLAPGDNLHSDPAVDWTSDGTAWALTLGISAGALVLRSYTSIDGGATWVLEATPSGAQTSVDREIIWVDHSPGSPFKDQVYATWHNGVPAFVARRTPGGGGAWQPPLQISGAEQTGPAIGNDIKTNSAGDVFAFYPDGDGSHKLRVVKSTDGGATFGAHVDFATIIASSRKLSIPADNGRKARVFISGGAYRTATKDLVYAVWPDLSGEPGCTSGLGPGSSVASTCKTRIWFTRSTDGAATWEAPRMINNQASLNDQFFSHLVVDETDGKLVVIYYDTINDPGRIRSDVWMQTSPDDGITWSAPVQITTAETDETAPGADGGNQYGDYIGLTGNAGTFFACWTDRRGGAREEIWGAGFIITALATAIANNGNFGAVCLGAFADELLTINNTADSPLSISSITSSSLDFQAPSVLSYPLIVSPGGSIDVMIRFEPTSPGPKTATITLISNDPAGPHNITVTGVCPVPHLNLAIADTGNFGKVCIGSFVDKPLILNNSGLCRLLVNGISSSSAEFLVPQVLSFPLAIGAGNSLALPIRFEPTSLGVKAAAVTVTSNDPTSPQTIAVSGSVPSGVLAVTGSTCFGGVKACCCAERTISICNVGDCNLHVTSVAFKRKSHHWKLINNPFPAALRPGSCLSVVIRYKATEKCPRCCELIINSDDPITPVKTLDVMAYTIWGDCCCKHCCADCQKGNCQKQHQECCCENGAQDCCDEDEEDEA